MSRRGVSAVGMASAFDRLQLRMCRLTRKCDGAEYGLLWAASRLYALDSSDDGVCARRLGYVLSGPYAEVLFVEGSFSRGSSSLRGLAIHSARGR